MIKINKNIISLSAISLFVIIGAAFFIIRGGGPSVKPPTEVNKIVKQEEVTNELKSENQVLTGEVYLKSNVSVANITLKANITKEAAKVLAEKYAKKLRGQYGELPVIVDVDQEGKAIIKKMIPVEKNQLAAEVNELMDLEYIVADLKGFSEKDVTKVLMNDKQLGNKSYNVEDGLLTVINANIDSKLKVVIGTETYDVVILVK